MKSLATTFALAVALNTYGPLACANEPTLTDVLQSCPKTANALLHGDFNAIRKLSSGTPLEMDLPSGVQRVRIAAEINLAALQPEWEIGYAALERMPTAEVIAQRMAGYVDAIGTRTVVWTPNQMYLIPLQNNVLSMVRPTDRKFVGQWLKRDRTNTVSDYLRTAAALPLSDYATMIAFDLEDVFSGEVLEKNLVDFKALQGRDVNAFANAIASIKGVTLMVRRDSLQNAAISLEFNEGSKELAAVLKSFLLEAMARRGTTIPELASWTQSNSNDLKKITFSGLFSAQALDDVLGIFTVHRFGGNVESATEAPAAAQANSGTPSPSIIAENSKDYFKKVVGMVNRVRDYSANNTGERAQWNGNMANRIDLLPILNVDTDLVNFGAEVAKALRSNMVSMQLTNISTGAQAVANDAGTSGFSTATAAGTMAGTFGSFGYGNGGGFVDSNSPMKYYQMGQAQGNTSFRQMMAQMEQAIADMRRTMTLKYKIQF